MRFLQEINRTIASANTSTGTRRQPSDIGEFDSPAVAGRLHFISATRRAMRCTSFALRLERVATAMRMTARSGPHLHSNCPQRRARAQRQPPARRPHEKKRLSARRMVDPRRESARRANVRLAAVLELWARRPLRVRVAENGELIGLERDVHRRSRGRLERCAAAIRTVARSGNRDTARTVILLEGRLRLASRHISGGHVAFARMSQPIAASSARARYAHDLQHEEAQQAANCSRPGAMLHTVAHRSTGLEDKKTDDLGGKLGLPRYPRFAPRA